MSEYTVKNIEGCKAFFGSVPPRDMDALLGTMSFGCIIDAQAAKHIGAVLVTGLPENIAKLMLKDAEKEVPL